MSLELSMVGLVVKSIPVSLEFYRRLGVEIPADADSEPFVMHRMESGVTLFWDTVFAKRYDPAREEPAGGYRIMLEFFLASEDAVDAKVSGAGRFRVSRPQRSGPDFRTLRRDGRRPPMET